MSSKENAAKTKAASALATAKAAALALVQKTTSSYTAAGVMSAAVANAAVAQVQAKLPSLVPNLAQPTASQHDATTIAWDAIMAAKRQALCACSANPPLDLPPCWVSLMTPPPATDQTPEAQFYRQFDVIALYLARNLIKQSTDTFDRSGADHVDIGDDSNANPQVQAIARAIEVYCLNMPYSTVKALGWKGALAKILQLPLTTWDNSKGMFTRSAGGSTNIPTPIQQRATDKWSVHPAYFAFFFWRGDLSFLRFLRYDATFGFVFTDTFAQKVQDSFWSCFYCPFAAVPIAPGGAGSGTLTSLGLGSDDFDASDPNSSWLDNPTNMPSTFTNALQTLGNNLYSAEAAQALSSMLQAISVFVALFTAGASLAATGALTVANGISIASALQGALGITNPVLGDVLIAGKVLNLDAFAADSGLDMSSAAPTVPVTPPDIVTPTLASIGAPTVSLDSIDTSSVDTSSIDTTNLDLSSLGDPTIDTSGLSGSQDVANSVVDQTQLTSQIFVTPPDVTVIDPTSGADLGAVTDGQAVNVTPQDPSTVTPADTATTGTDTSAADNAQQAAVGQATDSSGNFNLTSYIGAVAKIYSALTTAAKTGAAHPTTANHPTPGTRTVLPNGDSAVTNSDGSTTIYGTNGKALQTVLPSGAIVAGGPVGSSSTMLWALGGLAVVAALALTKTRRY
jgi:hypothetical protein